MVASYLAKARGTNEPDLSKQHYKELEQFLRDVNAFILDHGDERGQEWNPKIVGFRDRLDDIEAGAKRLERVFHPPQLNTHMGFIHVVRAREARRCKAWDPSQLG